MCVFIYINVPHTQKGGSENTYLGLNIIYISYTYSYMYMSYIYMVVY